MSTRLAALTAAVLLVAGAAAAGQSPPPANDDCLACHGDPDAKRENGTSIGVDQKVFTDSKHGPLECVDCHNPHASNATPGSGVTPMTWMSVSIAAASALGDAALDCAHSAPGANTSATINAATGRVVIWCINAATIARAEIGCFAPTLSAPPRPRGLRRR